MRFFSSELGHEYAKTYTFGYCNYGVLESGDKVSDMYERGYLPYSGSPESTGMFYMARSGRIYLPEFELDSECRRVAKKFDGVYSRKSIPLKEFPITEEFITFWLEYFSRAHGPVVMPRERLLSILDFGIISHVGEYRDAEHKVVAYTLEVHDETMVHDWYQAWIPELDKQSFGMWLLMDIGREAQKRGATYYYPGTVYGAMNYKTNLPSLSFWNGAEWITDKDNARLKERGKTDTARQVQLVDEWKEGRPLF
jgi:arginine-tRNA-protein transferase